MALFTTSKEAKGILDNLRRGGIRPNLWVRAALCYSLSTPSNEGLADFDSEGSEFQETTFFGPDKDVYVALIRQRLGYSPKQEDMGKVIKRHVERGIRLLAGDYQRVNRRHDELVMLLLRQALPSRQVPQPPATGDRWGADQVSGKVEISIGPDIHSGHLVKYEMNVPGASPHVAIMGRNGTGKTRTGLGLLGQFATMRHHVPFLVFDYAKGDIAANAEFVRNTNCTVITLPEGRIPRQPLELLDNDEYSIQLAARRFRDSIDSVVHLGPIQLDRCLRLIVKLYEESGTGRPTLEELVRLTEEEYQDNGWKEDSLLACIREFSAFPLFAYDASADRVFTDSHVIDIHRLPEDLRKIAVFLLLDSMYSQIMALPDAPLDSDGNRAMRLVIAIDEAHHYLPCRQPTLQKMIREVRSKGVGIWLFSQSPDDFDQRSYNFIREMGLNIVFSCMVDKAGMLDSALGAKIDPRRLSHLPAGVALVRPGGSETPLEVQAWRP